jgi:hypothetical protein
VACAWSSALPARTRRSHVHGRSRPCSTSICPVPTQSCDAAVADAAAREARSPCMSAGGRAVQYIGMLAEASTAFSGLSEARLRAQRAARRACAPSLRAAREGAVHGSASNSAGQAGIAARPCSVAYACAGVGHGQWAVRMRPAARPCAAQEPGGRRSLGPHPLQCLTGFRPATHKVFQYISETSS